MRKVNCKLCGCGESGLLEMYDIVPRSIAEQASMQKPKTVRLCSNCQQELSMWYSAKIGTLTYGIAAKRFVSKSPSQLVTEYEIAYQWFTRYKKAQLTKQQS